MKRVKKIVFVLISIILGIVLIFNAYNFVCINVLHKDLAAINGYAMLEVVSGSMEPTIHVGDIIIINTKETNYKEKDIITFRGKEGEFVTHRILSIEDDSMITQGDNNDSKDDSIKTNSIVGKYVAKINGAGKILSSFKNPFTMVMIFIIGLLACVLLSTDADGKPILDESELEFQEFLKNKNESKKVDSSKVTSSKKVVKKETAKKEDKTKTTTSTNKKKTNTPSKSDTKEKESKKISSAKKTSTTKTTNNSKTPSSSKKVEKTNVEKKAPTKKVEVSKPTVKKTTPKKEVVKKSEVKKTPVKKSTSSTKSVNSKKTNNKKETTKIKK